MKRILLLVMSIMILFSGSVFAENWQWVDSNDSVGFFFDKDSVKYDIMPALFVGQKEQIHRDIKNCWVKVAYTAKSASELAKSYDDDSFNSVSYSLEKWTMYKERIAVEFVAYYDNDGNTVYSSYVNNSSLIVPGSFGESVCIAVNSYCLNNDKKVLFNSRN